MGELLVYLADDDSEDRELFMDALSQIPIRTKVIQFTNGIELMDRLFSDKTLPDIIFLDLFMPHMDGFDCLMDIRNFKKFSTIKIVVYSSTYQEREVKQLKADGANGYIQKPNSYNLLKTLLYQAVKSVSDTENQPETINFDIIT
ncbi:MAG: response regulator [Pseudozobellia sp.]|nr:response regulator [Pseudozobellia sp.]